MTGLCSILILCALSFVPVLPSPAPVPSKEDSSRVSRLLPYTFKGSILPNILPPKGKLILFSCHVKSAHPVGSLHLEGTCIDIRGEIHTCKVTQIPNEIKLGPTS